MSKVSNFAFCLMFVGFAAGAGIRNIRSSGVVGGSSSYSSSSSSGGGNLAPHPGFNPNFAFSSVGFPGGVHPPNFMFPGGPGFVFPNPGFGGPHYMDPYQILLLQQSLMHQQIAQQQAILAQQQALAAQQKNLAKSSSQSSSNTFPDARMGSEYSGSTTSVQGTPGTGEIVFTGSGITMGPEGGHGEAFSYPGGPDGLGARISDDFEAPNKPQTLGVFSSSSSGVSTINGKTTSFKTSTYGKNEDGKITFRTINE